jgi:hypothetical protein
MQLGFGRFEFVRIKNGELMLIPGPRLLAPFEKRKVTQVSVAESRDTGSAAGRLVITIMAAVSQWERETIGERTSTHCATSAATASASGISSSVNGCLPQRHLEGLQNRWFP